VKALAFRRRRRHLPPPPLEVRLLEGPQVASVILKEAQRLVWDPVLAAAVILKEAQRLRWAPPTASPSAASIYGIQKVPA
jgi:hypothetical protein